MAYKLANAKLNDFLSSLCEGKVVFALTASEVSPGDIQYHLDRAGKWLGDTHVLGDYRPVEPLKALVFRPREFLGTLKDGKPAALPEQIVIGAKNCDVSALQIHDHVFLSTDPVDPYYKEAREKTIIVSCDCAAPRDVCFCTAVNEQPYPREGFDINLSPTRAGIIVETGSARGEALLEKVQVMLREVDEKASQERDAQREAVTAKVAAQSAEKGLKAGADYRKAIQASEEGPLWDTLAADCVECGACNFICCTCHCFQLADGRDTKGRAARMKQWDSCLYLNFARVAGGANPREHRAERLHNRFDKKFNFFPQVLDRYACDGCGRCAEACTGKIDIRDVLKKALDEQ